MKTIGDNVREHVKQGHRGTSDGIHFLELDLIPVNTNVAGNLYISALDIIKKQDADLTALREENEKLREAGTLLLEQYDAVSDFKMGGKLTNEPFMLMRAALAAHKD